MDGLNYTPTKMREVLFTYEVQCINNKIFFIYFVVVDTLH